MLFEKTNGKSLNYEWTQKLLLLNKKATKFNEVLVYVSVMNKKLQNYARKKDNELYTLNQCVVVAN